MWPFLLWLLDHWLLIIWGAGVVLAYVYGGQRLAFIVLTMGVGSFAYQRGQRAERAANNGRAETLNRERENAYEDIDNRDTNRDDIAERLRKHDY